MSPLFLAMGLQADTWEEKFVLDLLWRATRGAECKREGGTPPNAHFS